MNIPTIFLIKREVLNAFVEQCEKKELNPDDIVTAMLEERFVSKKRSDLEKIKEVIKKPKEEPKKNLSELTEELGELNNKKIALEDEGNTNTEEYMAIKERMEKVKMALMEA